MVKPRMPLWPALAFFLATSSVMAKDDSYLCEPKSTVGFGYDKYAKEWQPTHFTDNNNKYVLSKSSDQEKDWEIKELGASIGTKCTDGFTDDGFIECKGRMDFQMNNQTLRYIIVSKNGYVVNKLMADMIVEGALAAPYLEIGKCSPL